MIFSSKIKIQIEFSRDFKISYEGSLKDLKKLLQTIKPQELPGIGEIVQKFKRNNSLN